MVTSCNSCFFLASVGFLPVVYPFLVSFFMQLPFHKALVEDERQRSHETLVNKNISLEGYEFRLEAADVICLPCHLIARTG